MTQKTRDPLSQLLNWMNSTNQMDPQSPQFEINTWNYDGSQVKKFVMTHKKTGESINVTVNTTDHGYQHEIESVEEIG